MVSNRQLSYIAKASSPCPPSSSPLRSDSTVFKAFRSACHPYAHSERQPRFVGAERCSFLRLCPMAGPAATQSDIKPYMEIQNGEPPFRDLLPNAFKLERYLARYEMCSPYLLCCSDCEPLTLSETLQLADDECRNLWEKLSLGYTDSQGTPILREEICRLYTTVSAEDIMVAAPQELIAMALRAMLKPGDHVVAIRPAYQSLYELAQSAGCKVSFWDPEVEHSGSFSFDVTKLGQLVTAQTKAVIVNFPHNPTGALPSHKDWQQIVQQCRDHNAYLFSDEMYRLLERYPSSRLPAAVDCYERGVSLSGMSKAFGMPGIRIGWLALRDAALMRALQRLHDYSTICSAAPSEVLALIGLRAVKKLLQRNLAIIEANIEAFAAFCMRYNDLVEFSAPAAGSIAFARLLTGEPIEDFCERLVAKHGVLLLPATVYNHPASIADGRFRVGLGRKNVQQCLRALGPFLDSMKQ